MSDVKYCFSCGASLSLNDQFCYKCGQKQVVTSESESSASSENVNQEPINDSTMNNTKPETEKTEISDENDSSGNIPQTEADEEKNIINNDKPEVESKENVVEAKVNEPVNTYANDVNQQQKFEVPQQPITNQAPITQQVSSDQQAPSTQQVPSSQQVPSTQQVPSAQQAAPAAAPKKKKFPWFFTVLWLIMLGAVGIWGYLYFIHPDYDYPILTEDAQRFVLFTVAVASLIYTLSLKLSMKKFRAIPTILMVLFGIVIFVFFCLIELQDGDLLHDMVSDLVENVIPTFGE